MIELWKVGESPVAQKFNMLESPNSWTKTIKKAYSLNKEVTDIKHFQGEYWTAFKEYCKDIKISFKLKNPTAKYWFDISIGSSECHIRLTLNTQKNTLGLALYI